MQHRDGYGNEHDRTEKRGTEVSQEERDWVSRSYEQYYEKFPWERDDEEVEDDEVEQEEADNLYQSDDKSEEFEEEGRADHQADHQEDFDDDKAESTYTDVHFNDLKKARGRINGKPWKPPKTKGLYTPQFVRLQDLQSQGPARGAAEKPAVEVDTSEGR